MSEHTKTPWLVSARAHFRIVTEWGVTVATVGSDSDLRDQWEANAAFIVKAVNNHDVLVRALEDIDKHLDNFGYLPNMKARKLARAALSQARASAPPQPDQVD